MKDEGIIDEVVSSQYKVEMLLRSLPIKWVVRVTNNCIRGCDYTGSAKKDCLTDLPKWVVIGKVSYSRHLANESRAYRWAYLRKEVAEVQKDHAKWLRLKAERFEQRADRILEILRTESAK